MKDKLTFVYSNRKRSLVVKGMPSICIEQLSSEEWHAYKAVGCYPYLDFYSIEGNGKTPISAVKSYLRQAKKHRTEYEQESGWEDDIEE